MERFKIDGVQLLNADGNKIESLWYEKTQLAEKCESFGIKLNSSYNKQCQEIMLDEYSKIKKLFIVINFFASTSHAAVISLACNDE